MTSILARRANRRRFELYLNDLEKLKRKLESLHTLENSETQGETDDRSISYSSDRISKPLGDETDLTGHPGGITDSQLTAAMDSAGSDGPYGGNAPSLPLPSDDDSDRPSSGDKRNYSVVSDESDPASLSGTAANTDAHDTCVTERSSAITLDPSNSAQKISPIYDSPAATPHRNMVTVAQIAKFRDHHSKVQRILRGIRQNLKIAEAKQREGLAKRCRAARENRQAKPHRRLESQPTGNDWSWDTVEIEIMGGGKESPAPLISNRHRGVAPDDLVWEDEYRVAMDIECKGYAYRKDGIGRRVHRF